ncbi:hypothetical protein PIB30_097302 [Stylosanthes scabra]|uniref:Uncharacterized protein n=1 Tax=Stylosanthes scabra TaxID=79078 RepID=A0ABU6ZUX1_9FABA|nr:hypothetical protein [Stylosanthes scabra]
MIVLESAKRSSNGAGDISDRNEERVECVSNFHFTLIPCGEFGKESTAQSLGHVVGEVNDAKAEDKDADGPSRSTTMIATIMIFCNGTCCIVGGASSTCISRGGLVDGVKK